MSPDDAQMFPEPTDVPDSEQDVGPQEAEERKQMVARLKRELVGDLLTTAEVAEILEIHPRTVGEYIRVGKLKAINLGGGWKVSQGNLRSFLEQQGTSPEASSQASAGGIFGRMTDSARRVIVAAQTEARDLHHHYIAPEHLLLGILRGASAASEALTDFGVDFVTSRERIAAEVEAGPGRPTDKIPFTPACKRMLESTQQEALKLGQVQVGPEHLLLAMLEGEGGVAHRLLEGSVQGGVKAVRNRLLEILNGFSPDAENS